MQMSAALQQQPLPDDVRILFVAGCPRSGTTALQEYLNADPRIMIGRERYKWIPPEQITWASFQPTALLDFDPETEQYRTATRLMHMERILQSKEIPNLAWVGDKYPGYLAALQQLRTANPGCRFLITHRDIEPIVNSYVARSKNPDDSWLGGRDPLDLAINTWNRSLGQLLEALRSPNRDVLPVPYDSFHQSPRQWANRIGAFLDIAIPDSVVRVWEERSNAHRTHGGTANNLGPRELDRIAEKANRGLELQVKKAIEATLSKPSLWDRLTAVLRG
jgi:Sulfotransferase family